MRAHGVQRARSVVIIHGLSFMKEHTTMQAVHSGARQDVSARNNAPQWIQS